MLYEISLVYKGDWISRICIFSSSEINRRRLHYLPFWYQNLYEAFYDIFTVICSIQINTSDLLLVVYIWLAHALFMEIQRPLH